MPPSRDTCPAARVLVELLPAKLFICVVKYWVCD